MNLMNKVSPQNKNSYITKVDLNSAVQNIKTTMKENFVSKEGFDSSINPLKSDITVLKKDVKVLKEDVKVLKEDVSVLKGSVLNIEKKINIYSDMYEVNKWNSEKLANRVNKLEKHSGITPPQEFLVSGI